MGTARETHVPWLCAVFVLVCLTPSITGVVDVTIVSKYQFFDESDDTWLYCYYTGSTINQKGYQFGVEVNTGSGTRFPPQRTTTALTRGRSVRIWDTAGDFRVGAFSCQVRDGNQTEKAITFKMKSQADVWPVAFTVTASLGDPVMLQMVQKSNRTGIIEWRKGGAGGTVLIGQNGLSLTIASVQSSDEGIYECYYQGDTERKQGIMRLIVRGCAENKWDPPSCTSDCPVCYNGGVCDDNTGECVCPPGFHGHNCERACANGNIGTSCTRECDGGDCTGQLLCVMDPYGCSCAPGLMGIECYTECPDGLYGADCTQTCNCAAGPAACDKKTGFCTGGCPVSWTGDSCQIRTVTVSYVYIYEDLFTKEEGRYFGRSADNITSYSDIDAEECARRCLRGYGSYDGVNPTCLSFNHRPAGSPEGGSARCWLSSSEKDTAAFPGPEWDSWPYRNYYQRKHILSPQDCTDVFALGIQYSHVYTIGHPQPFQAYCDMDTDGGGWTVIQRRQDGSVSFNKTWTEYEQGFGNPTVEYWLGLKNIHSLTTQKQNELYVYLEDWEMNSRFARYSTFSVGDTSSKYTATIDGYSGDAGDSLDPPTTRHSINNRQFSTTDQDNDGVSSTDCAGTFGQGGWWYTPSCGYALLNGQYLTGCSVPTASCSSADGIVWYTWRRYQYSLKKTVMMIRPATFSVSSFRPCQNGGTLTSGPVESGLYICTCAHGWYGAFCDQESPKDVTVNVTTVNSTTLHVTWTVGVSGNLNIIDSQVRYKQSDTEDWGSWTSAGASIGAGDVYIHNLRPGAMYDVQLRVNTSLGWSDFNSGTGTTDETPPGSPSNLAAVPTSHNSVNLTWDPPIEPNGKIRNYTVQYGASQHCFEYEFLLEVTTTGDITTTVIGDLDPYTNYAFRVRASNSAGGSNFSDCNIVRTLKYYQSVPVAAIVGCSVSALLVVLLVTVGIVCYRRRNHEGDRDSTDPQIDLTIITENEPSMDESVENPAAIVEDLSPYDMTIYSIVDLVTVDDVVEFLKAKGLGQYAAAFRRHKVDGEGAMSLTSDMLAELVPEIGPRAKLQKSLQELKDNQVSWLLYLESAKGSRPLHPDWEISRSSLKLGKILGKGQFGEVRMGELRKRGVTQTVAVKTLKASSQEKDKEDLIGELDILVTVGRHDNIISLVGACTVGGPLTLVVEYAPNGCLKDWLINNHQTEMNRTNNRNNGILLPMEQLITFGIDIANGMSHLAAMQCVHRDLAARNVLLGKDLTAKISDFGLSRDIYEESEYVKSTQSQLPIRWIAYESLFYQVYTTQSDVWSFGIVMWEIMTMGKQPYGRMTGKELMELLPSGDRLEKPDLCPQDVYEVMKSCWETLPENRPTFPELKATLDRIIQDHKTYASLLN
ncbi:angiopoietin-1 receptor-like [Branchiostoma floridae x Branchiostoma belcheri]